MHDQRPPLQRNHRQADTRPAWTAPAIRRFRAGDAENGIVNNVTDGPFTFRS